MRNSTIDYQIRVEDQAYPTFKGASEHSVVGYVAGQPLVSRPWEAFQSVGRVLTLFAAFTAPIEYPDPRLELRRSGASSTLSMLQRRRGKRITLREARQMALDVLAKAKKELRMERTEEARFLLSPWDDEKA